MNCADLRAIADQRRLRTSYDPSIHAEAPALRAAAEPWLVVVPCRFGEIFPHGSGTLAAYCMGRTARADLEALRCGRVVQRGDFELVVAFGVNDFEKVAAVMRPRRRRIARPGAADHLKGFRFGENAASQSGSDDPFPSPATGAGVTGRSVSKRPR